jgi:predicted DNA-binding transcriptional regulator YafY
MASKGWNSITPGSGDDKCSLGNARGAGRSTGGMRLRSEGHDAFFAHTFGVMHTNHPQPVVIEFSDTAALMVQERLWHPQQKLTALPKGQVSLELTVSHLWDICPWILSWGSGAKVISPPELVDLVAEQAMETARLYQSKEVRGNCRTG